MIIIIIVHSLYRVVHVPSVAVDELLLIKTLFPKKWVKFKEIEISETLTSSVYDR